MQQTSSRASLRRLASALALCVIVAPCGALAGHVHDHRPVPGMISPAPGQKTPVYVHALHIHATQQRVRSVMVLANPTNTPQTLALGLPVKLSSFVRRFGMSGVDLDAQDCAKIARTKLRPVIKAGRRAITPSLVVPTGRGAKGCHVRWRWSVVVPARGRLRVVVTHAPSRFAEDDGQGFFLTMTELAAADHPELWGRPIRHAKVDLCGAGLARAVLRTPSGQHFTGADALQVVQVTHVLTPGARRDRRAGCVRWRYRAWRPEATDAVTLAIRADTRSLDMRLDPRSDEDITPAARARVGWCASGGLGSRRQLDRRALSVAELRGIEDEALRRLTSYPDRPDRTHSDAAIKARWRAAPPHAQAHFRAKVARALEGWIAAKLGDPTKGRCAKMVKAETDALKTRQLRANRSIVRTRAQVMEARHRKLARKVRRARSAGHLLRHVPVVPP